MKTVSFLLLLLFGILTTAATPSFPAAGDQTAVEGSDYTDGGRNAPATLLFATDSEHLFVVWRNGQVQKRSLPHLSPVAGVDLKEPLQGAALSHDGLFLALGAPQSKHLLILDTTDLHVVKQIPTHPTKKSTARVAHIETAAARNTFIITFSNAPQLWEVNYQMPPPAGFGNWVHDYRKDSGEAKITSFPVRKLWLGVVLPGFHLDREGVFVSGTDTQGSLVIFDLDLGRTTAIVPAASATAGAVE